MDQAQEPEPAPVTTEPAEETKPRQAATGALLGKRASRIGATVVIRGDLEAGEDLHIEGRVEGTIKHTADRLVICTKGVVHADIHAQRIEIEGTVEGDIYSSHSVTICETANVFGNISTPKISIAEGAYFKGNIDMEGPKATRH